mmetsp:Transcript_4634/g.9779  ORF Transcript_4634/g.9779 Transcript_4634/m.9779 type:complete len:226 (-) Transcript_4634:553-1230(-)
MCVFYVSTVPVSNAHLSSSILFWRFVFRNMLPTWSSIVLEAFPSSEAIPALVIPLHNSRSTAISLGVSLMSPASAALSEMETGSSLGRNTRRTDDSSRINRPRSDSDPSTERCRTMQESARVTSSSGSHGRTRTASAPARRHRIRSSASPRLETTSAGTDASDRSGLERRRRNKRRPSVSCDPEHPPACRTSRSGGASGAFPRFPRANSPRTATRPRSAASHAAS